jgi:uncharacterized protein with NRDE domain
MTYLKKTLLSTTKTLLSYDTIKLRTYIEIANTGNLNTLIVRGKFSQSELIRAWEEIVKKNAEANQDANYDLYLDALKAYGAHMEEYNMVKAMLLCLKYFVDDEYIKALRELGYKIDTSGRQAYASSIIAAERRSDNLVTKIKTKYKELEKMTRRDVASEETTVGALVAQVSFGLGFNLAEDIGLAQFNEYKKLLKEKYGRKRNHQAVGNI